MTSFGIVPSGKRHGTQVNTAIVLCERRLDGHRKQNDRDRTSRGAQGLPNAQILPIKPLPTYHPASTPLPLHGDKADLRWTFIPSQTQLEVPCRKHLTSSHEGPVGEALLSRRFHRINRGTDHTARRWLEVTGKPCCAPATYCPPEAARRHCDCGRLWPRPSHLLPRVASLLLLRRLQSPCIFLKAFMYENTTDT